MQIFVDSRAEIQSACLGHNLSDRSVFLFGSPTSLLRLLGPLLARVCCWPLAASGDVTQASRQMVNKHGGISRVMLVQETDSHMVTADPHAGTGHCRRSSAARDLGSLRGPTTSPMARRQPSLVCLRQMINRATRPGMSRHRPKTRTRCCAAPMPSATPSAMAVPSLACVPATWNTQTVTMWLGRGTVPLPAD